MAGCSGSHSAGDHKPSSLIWVLQSLCAIFRRPFNAALMARQVPPPHDTAMLVHAAQRVGLRLRETALPAESWEAMPLPLVLQLRVAARECQAVLLRVTGSRALWLAEGQTTPTDGALADLRSAYIGKCFLVQPEPETPKEPDQVAVKSFGFRWFVPELLKHRSVWHEVLGVSLVLQMLALGLPLFTQAIIDKVVVHRTESTLIALSVGMLVFVLFSALLTWVRQFLILHTGNRVDAVLGATVFQHLLRLPLQYFHYRPTGVVAARLQGVEAIREFVASAAISLLLDLPFLLICVAAMLFYSTHLTLIVLAVLALIGLLSFAVAPMLQGRLNAQFLLNARNQAFLTEHIAGFETVKSLQLEPQLQVRYSRYLAEYLQSGFQTRQLGNTYNVLANTLEQIMTLLILVGGAWLVMGAGTVNGEVFTVGMLVAFQMFASRLSQPMLRIVGLWQQFIQARLSVERLGDLMNAPTEPYSLVPTRVVDQRGEIEITQLGFRHASDLPMLYRGVDLRIAPGQTVAIMGASGTGKSTLSKLLLGFYRPTEGNIRIDGIDLLHMSADELRQHFGVVPQETVLFSGTVLDNVGLANPHAGFEQVVQACKMAEIHDTIQSLPKGYQTEIGERGTGLSGGQKQRLAIARALLRNPKMLIFDEATSALDAPTAEAFAHTLNRLRGKVSMLFVTHALPRGLHVDVSFVIDGGRLRKIAS